MNIIQTLKEELSAIETKIKETQISPAVYETIGLLNNRIKLARQIALLEWNDLSTKDKENKREEDLILTEKYFAKYPEDVRNKFLYKQQYILLIKKIKTLTSTDLAYAPLFNVLLIVLDSAEYINIHDNICIKAVFGQIESENNDAVSIYKALLNIPFEI